MHRFFTPGIRDSDVEVKLPESEAHHAARVLRIQPGEPVALLDGRGGIHRGMATSVGRHEVVIRLTEHDRQPARPFEITLIQAIAKGPAMEGLLHRAVELGCSRVVPLLAERSVSRPDDPAAKQARWESVALEAAKQSGNPWKMTVELPVSPSAWLSQTPGFDLLLVASLEGSPAHPFEALTRCQEQQGRPPRTVGILIGPEGDFTPAEYAAFRAAGAQSITLGPHVLRVETAVTAVLALVVNALTALADKVPFSNVPKPLAEN